MSLRASTFAGPDDLRRMQALVQRAWALDRPKVERHVGDLSWGTYQHLGREPEWERRLWHDGDELVAYGWLFRPGTLEHQVDPRRPELLHGVLGWFEETAEAKILVTSALADDAAARAILRRRGYVELRDGPWFAYLLHDLVELPEPRLPEGYRLRTMQGEEDVARRARVHQAAWKPSRLTVEAYRNLMRAWPYRPDLDCVAEALDGSFAAFALAWYDAENCVGLLEPVGTHPHHRRLGLARAVNVFALRQLRALGASLAIVAPRGDSAYPIPKRLYESIGFRQHSRSVSYRR